VPPEFGDELTRLMVLDLWNNSLTGNIPVLLANLSSLTSLVLGQNHLEGTIPPGLGGSRGLQLLTLAENNLFGEPPNSLYNLSSLEWLDLPGKHAPREHSCQYWQQISQHEASQLCDKPVYRINPYFTLQPHYSKDH